MPISHPFRLPTSQAANVKRDGGINALDEVLQRVNGLELVNGYLRISAKRRWMQKYVIVCAKNILCYVEKWETGELILLVSPV